jgi:2-polyprenyl-6-methoxyphenol hydroxylase-like FAD-dependent oxidoreductase
MTSSAYSEVLIAGGGPVGLTAALLLARAGVSVTVLEQEPGIARDLRASTFHPPTLDMLDTLGISDTLVREGIACPHWQIRLHPSGERAVFDLSVLAGETRHPYRLQCEQWKLAVALGEALAAEPKARVVFGARLDSFSQDDTGVDAIVTTVNVPDRDRRRSLHRPPRARLGVRGRDLSGDHTAGDDPGSIQ